MRFFDPCDVARCQTGDNKLMGWPAGYGATCGRSGRPANVLKGVARSLDFPKAVDAALTASNPRALSSRKQC
jgi:hypothetical protein